MEKEEQLLTAKKKIKTIAVKAVEGFQQTEEYNTVLFSWYFKGFELLRRYFTKHPFGVDLENLDLEEVDTEMAANEASTLLPLMVMLPRAHFLLQLVMIQLLTPNPITCKNFAFFFFFFFFGCPLYFGPFVSLIPKLLFFIFLFLKSILRTISLAQCLRVFGLDVKIIIIGLELN